MCVIIDANVAGQVFATPCSGDYRPLWDWVLERGGCIVYGGRLAAEILRMRNAARTLRVLSDAGKAHRCLDAQVFSEEEAVKAMGLCTSTDSHVIALARVSKARVLCSGDKALHADFKNLKLVPRPRGQIYQNASHARVLKHSIGCVGRPM
jgi:hypothetical protein